MLSRRSSWERCVCGGGDLCVHVYVEGGPGPPLLAYRFLPIQIPVYTGMHEEQKEEHSEWVVPRLKLLPLKQLIPTNFQPTVCILCHFVYHAGVRPRCRTGAAGH